MDCKNRHIEVLLACCKGKYQLTAKLLLWHLSILATLSVLICLFCYSFLDQSNAVWWKSRVWKPHLLWVCFFSNRCQSDSQGEAYSRGRGGPGCSLSFDKAFIWGNVTYSVNQLCRNILSVFSAASPQSLDCIYHVFPACTFFLSPSLPLQ